MASLTESELLDLLLPLIDSRPEFRRRLGLFLIDSLQRDVDQDLANASTKPRVSTAAPGSYRRPASGGSGPKVAPSDPVFAMFAHVRRLVIQASRHNLKENEIERQLEDEWNRLSDAERAKWREIANARKDERKE